MTDRTEQAHIKMTKANKKISEANGGPTNYFENLNIYLHASAGVESLAELKRVRELLFPFLKGEK